ncbi:cobalt-precorrin-7 (C(5))-methyltransferase [Xenorhabdus nematophila]|uniref:Cobalt-precorrin-6Y C(5)-methyltransferase (Cobalt-precorrin-6 methyltransferase) (Cobalt-precorrin-6Y methylase) n=1 Tax=Xenorhabdus nematophila (strain ATCC 19061 / DSM 3370 / CCUG 14189 / LMG 1036 / NCIMB 9965 / AN6) TaxID=406817 RepID=D3V926_XENNA|nr:cobalt-precorrin-7 (C(5))-methyltransferase [Xenorhabdus nematophila]CEE93987.1 putative cobalt-precorrin-6Y C(5)-methyltransferase (Cobalt-precorrin-6 methyltransferase) (Cobalt-precorrin-6Y methylase) [Xenorhabdus nematophila str. Anatoliense]CEF30764.1 putative cobalt-precorrin-6Y C(5)-methyltransferase (Cobalt-precorrin-6 methyltransferase) (Cobalt-precorrin-6Y methylase) [Xenorhabdus nematophila str. Websteri]AYA40820.1 cobalt-precorrin-7 (C(5))-methyltransferase [Xenorhabdus nematophila
MITVVGIGPGAAAHQTLAALDAIKQAEILVGGARHLAEFPHFCGETRRINADMDGLMMWLEQNQHRQIVVLASGDPLFYGIGKRIAAHFAERQTDKQNVRIISGISAIQYLCARILLDMNDIYLTSSHGRKPDFDWLLRHEKIAMVTDDVIGPYQIAQEILAHGQPRRMVIGENLSQENERIVCLNAEQIAQRGDIHYDLNVVVILNER